LLFLEKIGEYLFIDESSMSQRGLYTTIINKKAMGKKGSAVAIKK